MKPTGQLYLAPKSPSYLGAVLAYEGVFTIVLIAVAAGFGVIDKSLPDSPEAKRLASVAFLTCVACYFLVLPVLAHKAAKLRAQHGYAFWEGLNCAVQGVKLMLSFLPVVGFLFAPPPKTKRGERDVD